MLGPRMLEGKTRGLGVFPLPVPLPIQRRTPIGYSPNRLPVSIIASMFSTGIPPCSEWSELRM
jgi:hypothetical protein